MIALESREWTCRDLSRVLGAYLDGELEGPALVDADAHVSVCESCRERVHLSRALRGSLRTVVKTHAPVDFRARLATAMTAERSRSDARAKDAAKTRWLATWKTMVPLASAAAVGLAVFAAKDHGQALAFLGKSANTNLQASLVGDHLLNELIAEHARPLPPEQTDPTKVRALAQYVGVPVQPARFMRGRARLVGGRVLPVHTERAAMLQYEIGSGEGTRRVSVFIYDPRRIQVSGEELEAQEGSSNVRVGHGQGYSVAITQHGGVGYAVATDGDKSAQLIDFIDDREE